MNYSIEKIKNEYKEFKTKFLSRNFLRKYPEYKNFLINYYKLPENSKSGLILYLLEDKRIPKCIICNKNAKFINFEKEFLQTCGNKKCQLKLQSNKLKGKSKEEKIIKKCTICGKEFKSKSSTRKYCSNCKNNTFKCLECNTIKHISEKCNEITHIKICKHCALEYIFKNDWVKNYCKLPSFYICKNCGKIVYGITKINGKDIKFCSNCRKICPICGKRFGGQNLCCSRECAQKHKEKTYFEKFGENYKQVLSKNFPNKIEYWLNKGYNKKEGLFEVYKHQLRNNKFNNLKEFEKYLKINYEILKEYDEKLFLKIIKINSTLKTIYYEYYKKLFNFRNKNIYKIKRHKNSKGGNIYYVKYLNDTITLKSDLEFYFFNILKKYNIKFKNEKCYPNSNMRYDFYLIDYDIYIEIAGKMQEKEYRKKMNFKKKNFNSIILETKKEMLNFIKELTNEN